MNIGIIGSGNIGGNLGLLLAKAGHSILFSSRHPEQLEELVEEAGNNASVGTVTEAADFGEVVVLSVPFRAVEEVAAKVGALPGKILIETTNPYPERDGEMARRLRDSDRAASEFAADQFPEAHVIKAFNTIYYKHLKEHAFRPEEELRVLPYAGDHKPSLDAVKQLIDVIGFVGLYVGPLSGSHPMDVGRALFNKDLTMAEAKSLLNRS